MKETLKNLPQRHTPAPGPQVPGQACVSVAKFSYPLLTLMYSERSWLLVPS